MTLPTPRQTRALMKHLYELGVINDHSFASLHPLGRGFMDHLSYLKGHERYLPHGDKSNPDWLNPNLIVHSKLEKLGEFWHELRHKPVTRIPAEANQ